jgi:hypothetical protein
MGRYTLIERRPQRRTTGSDRFIRLELFGMRSV